ncbi:MAG: CRISPR-associated protein, Csd1 family [Firmicutes bacterium]|nr:CRISPR-associated protein, Csd1 family [Bacillota bacterium]
MILQALNEHYQRLTEDPDSGVAPPGYSPAKVSHVVVIDKSGEIVDIWSISENKGKKSVPKVLLVPEQVDHSVGICANYLCDNVTYALGIENGKNGERAFNKQKFDDFRAKNLELLHEVSTIGAIALSAFLSRWDENYANKDPVLLKVIDDLLKQSYNIIFKLDEENGYIHEQADIKQMWEIKDCNLENDEPVIAQCLITGQVGRVARLHPKIKNVVGAQISGAPFVSFNFDSLISYSPGKRCSDVQSYNAPVSIAASAAYSKSLNYLIASNTNRVRLADTTMIFWADKKGGKVEEMVLAWCLDPVTVDEGESDDGNRRIDPVAARQAKTILERVRTGLPSGDSKFDPQTRCYLLGLAPNNARLSVRFWQTSNFGDLLKHIAQHYDDMQIDGLERIGGMISPWRILRALAVQEEPKNIPPLLGGQFLKAILSGHMYPHTLYNLAINRCRIGGEHGGVNTVRAATIKAFLKRKYRLQGQKQEEELVSMSLNENNPSGAYQLGRLFSLLEKVQRDALGNQINATIRDRYFGAASATPGSVFPLLMRLSRHHIAKADYGNAMDKKIQDVVNRMDAFPSHLNLEEQGKFILGYYHQNQANYQKSDKNLEEKDG